MEMTPAKLWSLGKETILTSFKNLLKGAATQKQDEPETSRLAVSLEVLSPQKAEREELIGDNLIEGFPDKQGNNFLTVCPVPQTTIKSDDASNSDDEDSVRTVTQTRVSASRTSS